MKIERLSKRKSFSMFSTVLILYVLFMLLFITWVAAFLSQDKAVKININSYGEAYLELFIFFIVIPWFTFGFIFLLKDIWERTNWSGS